MWRYLSSAIWTVFALASFANIGRADPPAKAADRNTRVKTTTVRLSSSDSKEGIVGKIDADSLTLVEIKNTGEVKEYQYFPIDLLREGKFIRDVFPRSAYRWEDVKAGDKVELDVAEDRIDKQMYCMTICIHRRPNGRLPASQKEGEDKAFPWLRVYNDLENGVDVSDEEIKKVFPPRDPLSNRLIEKAYPGGLPKDYQEKLDAIRAKAKGLKATPPDKK